MKDKGYGEEKRVQGKLTCDVVNNRLENCRIEFLIQPEKPEEPEY